MLYSCMHEIELKESRFCSKMGIRVYRKDFLGDFDLGRIGKLVGVSWTPLHFTYMP